MEEKKTAASWDAAGVEAGKFEAFRNIIAALRSEEGCSWDRAQTLETLKPCLMNETVEVLAGIDLCRETRDARNLCEELGDLLLQVVLLAQVAQDEGLFAVEDVIRGISRKMIRRHPHVFGKESSAGCMPAGTDKSVFFSEKAQTACESKEEESLKDLWAEIKSAEKQCCTPLELQQQKNAVQEASRWASAYLNR